jgi:hypothetical protein
MKKIGFIFLLITLGYFCFAETWGELDSRVQLVHNRTLELMDQADNTNIDIDRHLLLGRIASAASWLSKRYDELINHFSSIWNRSQISKYRDYSDYWNKISEDLNNWAYDKELERLDNLIETGIDNPSVKELLEAFSTGQMRTNIDLRNGGSRP